MDHGPLPVGLLDLLVVGVPLHAQDLVEVLPLGLLQLQLRLLQQVPEQQHELKPVLLGVIGFVDPDPYSQIRVYGSGSRKAEEGKKRANKIGKN